MSYVILPDPHPGRCKCHRGGGAPNFEMLRCLGDENHEGTCWFPEPRPAQNLASASISSTQPEPKPWKAPARPA